MASYTPTILIMDSIADSRQTAELILTRIGYHVETAETAVQGLKLLHEKSFDLIVLDTRLSDKNGFLLCSELKLDKETKSIPILLTSAEIQGNDKVYGLDSGADGYLAKPMDALELIATVRSLLRMNEAERSLRESDDRQRLMIESLKDYAIFSLDLEGCISSWNSGAERMLGYTEEEVIGQRGSILYRPEDVEQGLFRQKLHTVTTTGKAEIECWHVAKDGEKIYVHGITSAVYDDAGRMIGFTKIARDITEQREIEEELRNTQQIYQNLADSVPALVWMMDADKDYYYFNKVWLDFTGKTLQEEIEGGFTLGVHPDDCEACISAFDDAFKDRTSLEVNYRLLRHDGEYRWVMDRGEPQYTDGHFIGYTGACIDIHDRVTAEQRLLESENRFAMALQGMSDGLFDFNLITQEVYFSPRYKSLIGYKDNEIVDSIHEIKKYFHPDDLEAAFANMEKDVSSGSMEYKNIFRMMHKDGSSRWMMSRGLIVRDETGKAIRIVGAHTDITEQKELEVQLREAYDRAESANMAKTEFLANMSHEIRTPMNAIIGLANILMSTSLTEKQKQFVTTLQLSAESLMALLNDLLDISKIEDNMITLEEIPFQLQDVVQNVVKMMSVKASEKSLDLDVVLPPAIKTVVGDSLRIQQILVNLVGNAIKFTSEGSVTITIDQKQDIKPHHQKIRIEVKDTGIGIPQGKLQAIFEKFTQADNSTTRKYGGSGLGLTICKALVEKMGGTISVSSEMGFGSTFVVELSLEDTEDHEVVEQILIEDVEDAVLMQSNCILLVEDYAPNILVATTILEKLGYNYETATSGAEAIDKFKNKLFHAVLMDVQMQEMDGMETTRHIRRWEKEQNLPPSYIIAMTAHALIGDREKCLDAGMDDYLSKPFNPDELKEKLATLD